MIQELFGGDDRGSGLVFPEDVEQRSVPGIRLNKVGQRSQASGEIPVRRGAPFLLLDGFQDLKMVVLPVSPLLEGGERILDSYQGVARGGGFRPGFGQLFFLLFRGRFPGGDFLLQVFDP